MIIPIELRFKADKDSKSVFQTGKTIKSHDVNSVEFHISIEGLELTDNYTAKILSVFHSSESQANMDCEIVEGKIIYKPDTNLISMYEHVTNYVYVYHNNQSLDVREFIYTVKLSKIDETSLEVKEVYDQSYADLLADFEQALNDYKDSLPQADSVRADIDVVLNQFSEDSQAKLNQYDNDAQQVIADNQTAFGLAETGRQDSYEQAETDRNQLSNQAVADWEQGADALLETAEGNESARVVDEASRVEKESERLQAETERIQAEQARKEAETERIQAEQARKEAETERIQAEQARKEAETLRVAQEEERKRLWEKAIKDPRIFGVLWDKTSSPTMTRTDDAVGLVAKIGIGSEYVRNDFDNLPIFRDIYRTTDDYGNLFVHIPKFYIKKKSGTSFYQLQISEVQHGGFYLPECFIDQETGREPDYILVGAYNANLSADGTRLESKKGNLPHVNNNIVQFRNLAKANGAGYQQMDIHVIDVIQMLFIVEFATLHSQSVHPGHTQGSEASESGLGDDILASSGATANNGLVPFVYRGIENPWGNVYQFVDGININNHQVWVARDARQYASNVFAEPYKKLSYVNHSETGWVTEMGYDENYPFAEFPIAIGGSSSTYYADHYYQSAGQRVARFGGHWSAGSAAGLSFWALSSSSAAACSVTGARLLKKAL